MRHFIHRLSPRRRAKLVRFLELASDNPNVRPDVRRRIERHLGKIKTELRFAEVLNLVVREAEGA